jgi:hypothetical protein
VDTSTLLKSLLDYSYDASGTTITDSSLMEWKYDDQRRIIQQSLKVGTRLDTVFYTYSNNGYTTDDHAYNSGSPSVGLFTTYYQHHNRTDSAITNNNSSTYYYYNQLGQDSLIKQIVGTNSAYPTVLTTNYYYTGQNLDSAVNIIHGILSSVFYYTNGNITGSNLYTLDANNVLQSTTQITYTNIPVGGLNVYFNSSVLQSGSTHFDVASGKTSVGTNTYQLDTTNRVTVWTINNGQPYSQKYLFTWY